MKKLLIITGPQGSGNHMWSKIFGVHSDVYGWSALQDNYWVGHDQEPFADCWRDPSLLKQFDWSQSDYYVTSISCPYMDNGEAKIPNLVRFAAEAMGCGIRVEVAVIGRDRNVLGYQESRVRGRSTYDTALDEFEKIQTWDLHYLSFELLQLYRGSYLRQLSKILDFPIDYRNPKIEEILVEDANQKYFTPIQHHWVDDLAKQTSRKWR